MIIKIPVQLVKYAVCQSTLKKVYRTNSVVQTMGFFVMLKQISTTGKITDYNNQINVISEITSYSRSNVYAYIKKCADLGIITISNSNIYLSSWKNVIVKFLPNDSYDSHKIELDTSQIEHKIKPKLLFYAAEIKYNKEVQQRIINNKWLQLNLSHSNNVTGADLASTLHQLQVNEFIGDKTDTLTADYINADVERTIRKLRQTYNFKSNWGVAYLKKVLQINGLCDIVERVNYSLSRNRISKNYYSGFNATIGATFWKLPDKIQVKI